MVSLILLIREPRRWCVGCEKCSPPDRDFDRDRPRLDVLLLDVRRRRRASRVFRIYLVIISREQRAEPFLVWVVVRFCFPGPPFPERCS